MKNFDYEETIKLKHDELPAKVNAQTGEVKVIERPKNNIPKGKTLFKQTDFAKVNTKTIKFLFDKCSKLEIAIILQMVGMADFNTNSLKPLSDEMSVRDLSKEFNISKNTVTQTFTNLFKLGVYAQFKISKGDIKEYWILNPYVSFKGKLIEDALVANFKDTEIEKYFNNKD